MKSYLFFKSYIKAVSPLKLSSGAEYQTDNDILRDKLGNPYIPGTTLAGICRHYLDAQGVNIDKYFGYTIHRMDKQEESKIIFHDAFICGDYTVSIRDGVRIGDDGTAEDTKKFDYEILEKDCHFELKIEFEDYDMEIIHKIFHGFNSGEICIGSKTSRGFGEVTLCEAKQYTVNFPSDIQKYIDFTWDDVTDLYKANDSLKSDILYDTFCYPFDLKSFVMIGNNNTLTKDENNGGKLVSSEQLTDAAKHPIIPGTSWAGLFKHHFKRILTDISFSEEQKEKFLNDVFGYANGDDAQKSKIVFMESTIESNKNKINIKRTAIDRFTGGSCNKKLFTVNLSFKGSSVLTIKIKKDIENKELLKNLIDVSIEDLKDGYLAIGGDTGIGGGLLDIKGGDAS